MKCKYCDRKADSSRYRKIELSIPRPDKNTKLNGKKTLSRDEKRPGLIPKVLPLSKYDIIIHENDIDFYEKKWETDITALNKKILHNIQKKHHSKKNKCNPNRVSSISEPTCVSNTSCSCISNTSCSSISTTDCCCSCESCDEYNPIDNNYLFAYKTDCQITIGNIWENVLYQILNTNIYENWVHSMPHIFICQTTGTYDITISSQFQISNASTNDKIMIRGINCNQNEDHIIPGSTSATSIDMENGYKTITQSFLAKFRKNDVFKSQFATTTPNIKLNSILTTPLDSVLANSSSLIITRIK